MVYSCVTWQTTAQNLCKHKHFAAGRKCTFVVPTPTALFIDTDSNAGAKLNTAPNSQTLTPTKTFAAPVRQNRQTQACGHMAGNVSKAWSG
jgi:hypothetical protein